MKENINESIEENEVKPKKKKFKIILFIISILCIAFIILYFTNSDINTMTNNLLKKAPIVGTTFEGIPSEEENEERKRVLAKYYLSLDNDRTVDKLMILKKEDKKLYDDVVLQMNKIDLSNTKTILEEIRNKELKKDILQREIDTMNEEKLNEIKDISNNYLKLGLVGTINNLEEDIIDLKLDFEDAAKIMENFKPEYAAKVFYYMDENIALTIKENISKTYNKELEKEIIKYEEYVKEKEKLAAIYKNKKQEESATQLQNKDMYSSEDLGIIFANMDYLTAAKILSEFQDREHLNSVLSQIKDVEQLNKDNENFTNIFSDINNTLKILDMYKRDLDTLKSSYEKMTPREIVNLVNQMTSSKPKFKEYKIDEGKSFTISEEELMIEILKRLKPKLLSQVIANLDDEKGAEISRKIGLPKQQN
ncbi:MotE family protein [Tepidibacter formicigenes]|jgi:flagellar motility protein MotE (MotC chaperone)|uniref:Flagellar motility protein MotE, a chaperone for MotC folding n=1 Tax=Tepidibacter formicigenes DSM 15518 TaxID=1123349 RepID=A0A1M6J9A6_9FIRM|nr:hypothetical protein [Tepidibacter formicigenes]SHJ43244.1 hypothetical protein SAMN02744037_00030 [Tepidibacter formicigenes DSM 15518]